MRLNWCEIFDLRADLLLYVEYFMRQFDLLLKDKV